MRTVVRFRTVNLRYPQIAVATGDAIEYAEADVELALTIHPAPEPDIPSADPISGVDGEQSLFA